MKKISTLLVISSILFFLSACGPTIPDAKMQELNKLENTLDSSEKLLLSIDSADAFATIAKFRENLNFIQSEMNDTLPMRAAVVVDKYFRFRKIVDNYQNNYSIIKDEVNTSQEQLRNLRFDAENGLVEEKKFDDYFALEKENIEAVEAAIGKMTSDLEQTLPVLKEQTPKVDSIIKVYFKEVSQEK